MGTLYVASCDRPGWRRWGYGWEPATLISVGEKHPNAERVLTEAQYADYKRFCETPNFPLHIREAGQDAGADLELRAALAEERDALLKVRDSLAADRESLETEIAELNRSKVAMAREIAELTARRDACLSAANAAEAKARKKK